MVSSVFSPQVRFNPVLTEEKEPDSFGQDWSANLWPQQATEPSVFTPQVWSSPPLTEANSPPGGVD